MRRLRLTILLALLITTVWFTGRQAGYTELAVRWVRNSELGKLVRREPELFAWVEARPEMNIDMGLLPAPVPASWRLELESDDRRTWRSPDAVELSAGAMSTGRLIENLELGYWVRGSDYGAVDATAAEWIVDNELLPMVLAAESMFFEHPNSDTHEILNSLAGFAEAEIENFKAEFDVEFVDAEQALIASLDRADEVHERTGWIEIHEGVWERYFEGRFLHEVRIQHYTETPEALLWLVEEVLAPTAERAERMIERLGFEEAKERGFVNDLEHYRLALRALENQRPALEAGDIVQE